MNRFIRFGASTALLVLSAVGRADHIKVEVNGEPVIFSGAGPQKISGRVLVPLRGVLEKLGAFVDWTPATQTVIASRGNLDLQLKIGSRTAIVNGQEVALDVPATTIAGSTMVPLRFVGETLGADVRWDAGSSTVLITSSAAEPADPNSRPRRRRDGYARRGDDRTSDRDRDLISDRDRNIDRDRDRNSDRQRDRDRNVDPVRDRDRDRDPVITPAPAARPTIDRLSLDRTSGWLRAGESLTVRMRGTPGSEASFRIPGVAENVKMREISPGVYEQSWTVPGNANLNLAEAPVLGMLQAKGADARDASVVQSSSLVQVDNAAPKISEANPAPKSEVSRSRPLISAVINDQGGSGIDTDRVRIVVDGRDVTRDAAVTAQFFSYTPPQDLAGRNHHVEVTVPDRAGNVSKQEWDFTAPESQAAVKGIQQIKTNAMGDMRQGGRLDHTVTGIPGGRASWSLGNIKNVPMREIRPGVYAGSYIFRETDDVNKAHLTVTLTGPDGRRYTETVSESTTLVSGAPEPPTITFPSPKDEITDPLIIRGRGMPNSTVRLKIDYAEKVLGVLAVKGVAGQMEVTVGANGRWETRPIDLGSLSRSRDAQINVTVTAVNSRQQESTPVKMRIR